MEKTLNENWNLDSLYEGGSQSTELKEFISHLNHTIEEIISEMNTMKTTQDFRTVHLLNLFQKIQQVMSGSFQVDEFLICVSSDNVKDENATKLLAESANTKAAFETLEVEFDQLLEALPENLWVELHQHDEVKGYQFYLEERKKSMKDKLSPEMESMIQNLSINGFTGWESHYDHLISNLRIPVEKDGQEEKLSIGQALSQVMFAPDKSTRQQIIQSYNQVCEANADSFASVLNHITGFRLDLYKQRGWSNVLKESLDQNRISEQTVNTMVSVIEENQSMLRQFLKRKAQLANVDKLGWYDIPTSTFTSQKKLSYSEATDTVIRQFHSFSEKLGSFAERAFHERWVEAEDRSDKPNGAFCASMPLAKESRVFLSFRGHEQDVVTIAHELGHAYHNYILHDEPAFAQKKGSSVAEIASTFSENLVLDAAIDRASTDQEKLSLLEMKIVAGLLYLGIVPSMYQFEQKLYKKRRYGLLSSKEISELLNEAEDNLYGDIVDEFDTYRWITTPHFYSTEKPFFNIPYTIGYLFSNGVYALAKEEGTQFADKYDELLRNSGRMTVEQLAEIYLQQDLSKKDFWEASIKPVSDAIEEYMELTESMV